MRLSWLTRTNVGHRTPHCLLLTGAMESALAGPHEGDQVGGAIDGTTMTIPDGLRNLAAYSKQAGSHGGPGHPLLRLVALVAYGTRTVIDAVFGPFSCASRIFTRQLRRSLNGVIFSNYTHEK